MFPEPLSMEKNTERSLARLCKQHFGLEISNLQEMPACGSYRRYYRIYLPAPAPASVIGVWNADLRENAAFVSFAQSFYRAGLPVPQIYAADPQGCIYLQQDLGDQSLFSLLNSEWFPVKDKPAARFPERLFLLYKKSLSCLLDMQLAGKDCIDYSKSTPSASFHRDAMHWDLNYFKYFFLRLLKIPFDEQALENDFRSLVDFLQTAPSDYFLFRDFQTANIMVMEDEPYFIDFQGGRRGLLQYDPASLLYDAKSYLPRNSRTELLEYYVSLLETKADVRAGDFLHYFHSAVLLRLMQALAAFGFRGVVERKPGFKESIPPALDLIDELMQDWNLPIPLREIHSCFVHMLTVKELRSF
jgi:aminoglycoside/choline kinase family phosphotransferase